MAAAGHIGICYDTFRDWVELHPEFSAAVKRGQAVRTVFLERGLLDAETGPQVTSRIFALKNAAPDEWRDKIETQHSGSVTVDSPAEKLAQFLNGAKSG